MNRVNSRHLLSRLILISGPPGIGKSTLSKSLARKLSETRSVTLLDKDCIDEPFSPNDRGNAYTKTVEPKVLTALLNLARLNLDPGREVILDVPWTHILLNSPDWVKKIQALVKETSSKLLVIECVLPESALKKRIQIRGLKRDQIKLTEKGWQKFSRTDRLGERNPLPHTVLNLDQTPTACLKEALKLLLSKE